MIHRLLLARRLGRVFGQREIERPFLAAGSYKQRKQDDGK